MDKAVAAVEKKEMTLRKASRVYDIPLSTLHDHISGKVRFGAKSGPTPYLTMPEEEELVFFLFHAAKIGYPHTKKKVLYIVQQMINRKGIKAQVTPGWWERFKGRHPEVVLRSADSLSLMRSIASDRDVIERYFDLLEDTLKQNGIYNKPNCIFNCDETGLPLCPKSLKVATFKGANSFAITGESKSQITILGCSNAAGFVLPPFVIFKRETFNRELCQGEVPGTLYGTSKNGWMDRNHFEKWFCNHFLFYCPKTRPIILLMDGHFSHYCPDLIRQAAAEQIVLLALPPHTTHFAQPLDNGCYGPLKMQWRQVCQEFCTSNPGRVVTLYDFSHLFGKAWLAAMTPSNIISSFKTTGICPFNRYSFHLPDDDYASFKPEVLAKKTGLAHVPLYSPGDRYVSTPKQSNYFSPVATPQLRDESAYLLEPMCSSISDFLQTPKAPSTFPIKRIKSCGQVMTNLEISTAIEKREKAKKSNKQEHGAVAQKPLRIVGRKTVSYQDSDDVPVYSNSKAVSLNTRGRKTVSDKDFDDEYSNSKTGSLGRKTVSDKDSDDVPVYSNSKAVSLNTRGRKTVSDKDTDDVPVYSNSKAVSLNTRGRKTVNTRARKTVSDKDTDDVPVYSNSKAVSLNTRGRKTVNTRARKTVSDKDTDDVPVYSNSKAVSLNTRARKTVSDKDSDDVPVYSNSKAVSLNTRGRKTRARKTVSDKDSDEVYTCSNSKSNTRGRKTVSDKDSYEVCSNSASSQYWIQSLYLSLIDKQILCQDMTIPDTIINAAHRLLSQQFKHVSGFQSTLHSQRLQFLKISPEKVSVQILHTGGNHWVCVSSVNGRVILMDSLIITHELEPTLQVQIAKIYSNHLDFIEVNTLSVQQQMGNTDCGLFAITFALEVCEGRRPDAIIFDQKQMRQHLYRCFENLHITQFPVFTANVSVKEATLGIIYLFCFCKLPEEYDTDMIECSVCKIWYHFKCVGLENEFLDEEEDWECPNCSN